MIYASVEDTSNFIKCDFKKRKSSTEAKFLWKTTLPTSSYYEKEKNNNSKWPQQWQYIAMNHCKLCNQVSLSTHVNYL